MRVGIVGSRNYPDLDQVERFVHALSLKYPLATVVSGGAPGVDNEAELAARSRMLDVRSFQPKKHNRHYAIVLYETGRFATTIRGDDGRSLTFKSYGQAAFFRDTLIAEDIDQLVAFHYQASKGTQHTIDHAKKLGKPVHIFTPKT